MSMRSGMVSLCAAALLGVAAFAGWAQSTTDTGADQDTQCDDARSVEVLQEIPFNQTGGRQAARETAIREAVIDALQRVAGADIARATQVETKSSGNSIEQNTREHLVVRSGGRVRDWDVVSEEIVSDGFGQALSVLVRVDVCVSDEQAAAPFVLAIANADPSSQELSDELRARIAEEFEIHDGLMLVRTRPSDGYHDVRIEFEHVINVQDVDNSDKVETLKQFGASDTLGAQSLRFRLVTVTATVSAVRFVDEATISVTAERRRRIPADAPPETAIRDLVLEASLIASQPLGHRLNSGELNYSRP